MPTNCAQLCRHTNPDLEISRLGTGGGVCLQNVSLLSAEPCPVLPANTLRQESSTGDLSVIGKETNRLCRFGDRRNPPRRHQYSNNGAKDQSNQNPEEEKMT